MKGQVIKQDTIKRSDLQRAPNTLFVFGDNMVRQGFGGQAKEMRGEPNAVGIPTKWIPATNARAYFCNGDFSRVKVSIDFELTKLERAIENGWNVVIPSSGIGTGLADLKNKAPKIYKYIQDRLAGLESL
jgi:hypothetical protein